MNPRFKTDLQDSLYSRNSKHRHFRLNAKVNCNKPKLIGGYTAEDKVVNSDFTKSFNKFLENNIKKVLFRFDNRPLAARARELSSKYDQAYNDLNASKDNLFEVTNKTFACRDALPEHSSGFEQSNFKELIENTKNVPKYLPQEQEGNMFGKSFSYYKYWLPESPEISSEQFDNAHLFQSINRQIDYSNRTQNFGPGLRDKAQKVKALVEEKSKKFAKDVGLSSNTEERLRLELKGSEGLYTNTKWFQRTKKIGPHSEKYVRKLLKPWMKEGLPSTNSVIRLSKMRFYKRIYYDILEGCCSFQRGRQSVEGKENLKDVSDLLKRTYGDHGAYEQALYKRWLKHLRISQAITAYTRAFNISFKEFNAIHENLFKAAAINVKSIKRNSIVKNYCCGKKSWKIPSNETFNAENRIMGNPDFQTASRLLSRKSRKCVCKSNPFATYDSHVLSSMRRRFTLANVIFRKYRKYNIMMMTYNEKDVELSRSNLCDVGCKRFVVCNNSPNAIFNKLHKRFLKKNATLCPPINLCDEKSFHERKNVLGDVKHEESTRNINPADGKTLKSRKLFCTQNTFDGGIRKDKANAAAPSFVVHDYFENRFSRDPIEEIENFKVRNYNRIWKEEADSEACMSPRMLPRDPFFFRNPLGTNYPLQRYESEVNIHNDFYKKVNESRQHYLGYTLELYYWIRAFFAEYRRIKNNLHPLNYSFRKAFLPDPYLHFCPIAKMPDLNWMIMKLQNSESISKSFGYGSLSAMEAGNIKSWKSCVDRQKRFLTGIKYFYNMRRFMPFKGLPCSSCYPDFQVPPEKPGSSASSSKLKVSSNLSKQQTEAEIKTNQGRKICCGLIENSAFIHPENNLVNSPILQDDPKIFSQILQKLLSDIKIFGNIHRTKEQKFKENILAPIISASKDFFWKYYREYLCLFTKEPAVLGNLYNCKVIKKYKDDGLASGATEEIPHRRKSSKTMKGKKHDVLDHGTMTRGLSTITKKYFSDEMDYDLNHSYTLHKFKNMSKLGSGIDSDNFKSEILNELLENIEYVISEECIGALTNNDSMRDKVLEKLVTQDSDDSEWTIFENKNREKSGELMEGIRGSVTPSEMSLVQYESDSPTSNPEDMETTPFSEQTTLDGNQSPKKDASDETPFQEAAVVAYAMIDSKLPGGTEGTTPRTGQTSQGYSNIHSTASEKTEAALNSKISQERAKMVADGDVFRRSFTFQFPGNERGFPTQSDPSIQDLPYVHDDDLSDFSEVEVDSQPLAYGDIIKEVPSEIWAKRKPNKIEGMRKTFSAMTLPSETVSFFSELDSEKSETEINDYDLKEDELDDHTTENIWFYDNYGKPQKHLTRTNRIINAKGGNIYPVEGVLTTQWYYSELAQHAAKKKVLHLVINCWNNHLNKWFERLGNEKKWANEKQNKKKMASSDSKHNVFWSNRKIAIDKDFRKRVFTPTAPDTYNNFYKTQYNAVQSWIHKTHVSPDHSKSGWFEVIRKKEEEKIKDLEELIRKSSGADPELSANAIDKIREHHLKRYGSELNTYSRVWDRFWGHWKKGRYSDVLEPSMYDAGMVEGDSEDEVAWEGELVLGFPKYAKWRRTRSLAEDYERYTTNKRFYDEMLEDIKDAMAERNSSRDALYIQSVCKSALLK